MTDEAWWEPTLPTALNQGDIFKDVPFALLPSPIVPLISTNLKGGVRGWAEHKIPKVGSDKRANFLAAGPLSAALVLSHGCDIDKPHCKRLTVALVAPTHDLSPSQRSIVEAQRSVSMLYLPDVPGYGDAFADLRLLSCIPTSEIRALPRIASMTEQAQLRLQAQIHAHFLRRGLVE